MVRGWSPMMREMIRTPLLMGEQVATVEEAIAFAYYPQAGKRSVGGADRYGLSGRGSPGGIQGCREADQQRTQRNHKDVGCFQAYRQRADIVDIGRKMDEGITFAIRAAKRRFIDQVNAPFF